MDESHIEKQAVGKEEGLLLPASIIVAAAMIASAWIYTGGLGYRENQVKPEERVFGSALEELVLPSEGVVLPVAWRDLGIQMVRSGVIDKEKFEKLYENRSGLGQDEKKLLDLADNGNIKITEENSGFILNLFWALGLGNKNRVLEEGPMADARYGGAGGFASTAGWTLAKGSAMDHYSKHSFVTLTREQQAMVERVSRNIYRPCCDNSTYFPDCNHGMAMLGLLELMASQGVGEDEMYKVALAVNSYWFPDNYLTIAKYMASKGVDWSKVDPKALLGILISFLLIAYALRKRKANSLISFSICWFFLTLLPVSNIYPIGFYMAEHYLYLPSIGFFLALAYGLNNVLSIKRLRIFSIAAR